MPDAVPSQSVASTSARPSPPGLGGAGALPPETPIRLVSPHAGAVMQLRDEMYAESWKALQANRNVLHKTKRSMISFADTAKPQTSQVVELGVNIVGGIAIAVVVGLLALPVGWALVLSAAVVLLFGFITKRIFNAYRRSKAKRKVLAELQAMEDSSEYKPSFDDADLAEMFLAVLVRDYGLLENEHKHFLKHGHKDKSDPEHKISDRIVGTFGFGKMHNQERLKHRIRRINGYIDWLEKYFDHVEGELRAPIKDHLAQVDTGVSMLVEALIADLGAHEGCGVSLCFRPSEHQTRSKTMTAAELAQQDPKRLRELEEHLRGKTAAPIGAAATSGPSLVAFSTDSSTTRAVAEGYGPDQAINAGFAGLSAMADGAAKNAGQLSEAAAQTPGFMIGAAGGGWGAILSAGIARGIAAMRVNYPLQSRVSKIKARMDEPGEGDLSEDLRKGARKNDLDALTRCMDKVHKHYIKRVHDRSTKLQKLLNELKERETGPTARYRQALHSCTEATILVRYYLKVFHYLEKSMVHILILRASVQLIKENVDPFRHQFAQRTTPSSKRR